MNAEDIFVIAQKYKLEKEDSTKSSFGAISIQFRINAEGIFCNSPEFNSGN